MHGVCVDVYANRINYAVASNLHITVDALNGGGVGWQWDAATRTLAMRNLIVSASAKDTSALALPTNTTVDLDGINLVLGSDDTANALMGVGNLTVTGSGTLVVLGGSGVSSRAIYIDDGNDNDDDNENSLTVAGGAVIAIGGAASSDSVGICAPNVCVTDGTVLAVGGASRIDTAGISAIDVAAAGIITAVGGIAARNSHGIAAIGRVAIADTADVAAIGGVAGYNCGILADDGVSVSGGTLIVTDSNIKV